jgi:hypothetical protein
LIVVTPIPSNRTPTPDLAQVDDVLPFTGPPAAGATADRLCSDRSPGLEAAALRGVAFGLPISLVLWIALLLLLS